MSEDIKGNQGHPEEGSASVSPTVSEGQSKPKVDLHQLDEFKEVQRAYDRQIAAARQEAAAARQEAAKARQEAEEVQLIFRDAVSQFDPAAGNELAQAAELRVLRLRNQQLMEDEERRAEERRAKEEEARWRREYESYAQSRGIDPQRVAAALDRSLAAGSMVPLLDAIAAIQREDLLKERAAQSAPPQEGHDFVLPPRGEMKPDAGSKADEYFKQMARVSGDIEGRALVRGRFPNWKTYEENRNG